MPSLRMPLAQIGLLSFLVLVIALPSQAMKKRPLEKIEKTRSASWDDIAAMGLFIIPPAQRGLFYDLKQEDEKKLFYARKLDEEMKSYEVWRQKDQKKYENYQGPFKSSQPHPHPKLDELKLDEDFISEARKSIITKVEIVIIRPRGKKEPLIITETGKVWCRHFEQGFCDSTRFVTKTTSAVGLLPSGVVKVTTLSGTWEITLFQIGFSINPNCISHNSTFYSWTLAKLIEDTCQRNGHTIEPALFRGLSGQQHLKEQKKYWREYQSSPKASDKKSKNKPPAGS